MALTAAAMIVGPAAILVDPTFQGLAISLIPPKGSLPDACASRTPRTSRN